MSNYIKLSTGEIKTQGEWRQANKHISLPRVWTANTLTDLGLTAVLAAPKPDYTDLQQVAGNGVTTDANGNTIEAWSVVDKFSDTTGEDGVVTTKAEHETAYTASLVADKETGIRTDRDQRIALTDWTALSDVTMSADMATYRQALRDITAHANFPDLDAEDWPTKLEA
tara:strand:- start:1097 stop:1603 length:507 start_codon:yes stop_codon:yes gene_type:complete